MRAAVVPEPDPATPDDAFAAALIGEVGSLRAYARKLNGSAVDTDDLLQDTMLRC